MDAPPDVNANRHAVRWRWLAALVVVAAVVFGALWIGRQDPALQAGSPRSTNSSSSSADRSYVVMAAGDISCGSASRSNCRQRATADVVLAAHPDAVLLLGDDQYECGLLKDYQAFFDPTWGRFKSLIRPAPGNHEYTTSKHPDNACYNLPTGAPGYYTYFGKAASPLDSNCTVDCRGYYSYDLGNWHMVALNSNCTRIGNCRAGDPQVVWLQQDLAAHPNQCILAYWHHPRFSSGEHGDQLFMATIYETLYKAGADIVLAGHDHDYERFAPLDPSGNVDNPRGIRNFVVGTGGRNHYGLNQPQTGSQVRDSKTFGALRLTLSTGHYSWKFMPIAGSTFTDSGSGTCHN